MKRSLQVPPLAAPERLDKFLIRHFPRSSRHYWRDRLEATVRIDGKKAAKGRMLWGGERIELLEEPLEVNPALRGNPKLPLRILYQDEHLFIVEKPAGLPCHPLRRTERDTLAQAVVAAFPEQARLQPAREAGLVHRLDNETSGLVLFARDAETLARLRRLSQAGKIEKLYLALVIGRLTGRGEIEHPIGHHPKNRKKMCAATNPAEAKRLKARPAHTEYRVLQAGIDASLLRVKIRVGARHQIRVHLASLGHPLCGDRLYGTAGPAPRHLLHAAELRFLHPWTGKKIRVAVEPPQEFGEARDRLVSRSN